MAKKLTIELSDELYEKIENLSKKAKTPIYEPTVEEFIVEYLTSQFLFDSIGKLNENMKDLLKNFDQNSDLLKNFYDEFLSVMSSAKDSNKEDELEKKDQKTKDNISKTTTKKYKS